MDLFIPIFRFLWENVEFLQGIDAALQEQSGKEVAVGTSHVPIVGLKYLANEEF